MLFFYLYKFILGLTFVVHDELNDAEFTVVYRLAWWIKFKEYSTKILMQMTLAWSQKGVNAVQ